MDKTKNCVFCYKHTADRCINKIPIDDYLHVKKNLSQSDNHQTL